MPTAIKNCSIQRAKGLEEQGLDQDLQQVLAVAIFYTVYPIHPLCFAMMCMRTFVKTNSVTGSICDAK